MKAQVIYNEKAQAVRRSRAQVIYNQSDQKLINVDLLAGNRIGPQGLKGDSAYTVAKKHGFQGTEEQWLLSLKGQTGAVGPQGEKGQKGDTGEVGPKGDKGDKGDVGPRGFMGPTGPQGPVGAKGDKGAAFTYNDFTPDQLEALRGPRGRQGPQGQKGDKGNTGRTPVITASRDDKITTLYSDGQFIVNIRDGEKGEQGIQGIQGPKGEKGDRGDSYILTQADKIEIANIIDIPIEDVQINNTSILQGKIANIPIANSNTLGVAKVGGNGLNIIDGQIMVSRCTDDEIKAGINQNKPVVPSNQNISTFYGLAKAAGDITQSVSSNAVGIYTDEAKAAIKSMLGFATSSDISDAISQIVGFDFSIVQQLPATGQKGIIYLISHSHDVNDGYDEYIWINNGYEKLGHTDVDLSGYMETTDIITNAQIDTILGS